jgi:hypothetical protein
MFNVNICPIDYQLALSSDLKENLTQQLKEYFEFSEFDFWQSKNVEMSGDFQYEHPVTCPYCLKLMALQDFQKERLEEMLETQKSDQIEFDMPCCKQHTKLASVSFENSAFSNWGIHIHTSSRVVIQEFVDNMITSVPLKIVEPIAN